MVGTVSIGCVYTSIKRGYGTLEVQLLNNANELHKLPIMT